MRIVLIMICTESKPAPKTAPAPSVTLRRNAGTGVLDSAALLGSRNEVEITHQGETYRLRRTRQGKLILTK